MYLLSRIGSAGKFSEALAALDQVRAPVGRGLRAQLLALAGDRIAAQQLLAELEKRFPTEPGPPGGWRWPILRSTTKMAPFSGSRGGWRSGTKRLLLA